MKQITDVVLMIRPASFRSNEETAVNNYFQSAHKESIEEINTKAQKEFDHFVGLLQNEGIYVIVFQDDVENDTPDSIFPNNWVSFHESGNIVLYPMFAENRRRERREEILELIEDHGFAIENVYDYTDAEAENLFLEGTGSIILDREHKIAYCALSPRADEELFIEFCEDLEYTPVVFNAYQTVKEERLPIYHTNVMMCVGATFAVICSSSIDDKTERKNVLQSLKDSDKTIVDISEAQMHQFAGNMLQVKSRTNDETFLIMSQTAQESLTENQIKELKKHTNILSAPLHTIETYGGGSARCMLAEVFLPEN
jgi:hypothetical protein